MRFSNRDKYMLMGIILGLLIFINVLLLKTTVDAHEARKFNLYSII
jgi:hypothetical protein